MSPYPRVFRLRQHFPRPRVADVPDAVESALAALHLADRVRPGHRVAISAGSRGIANMAVILRAAVRISGGWVPSRSSCRPWGVMGAARRKGRNGFSRPTGSLRSSAGARSVPAWTP